MHAVAPKTKSRLNSWRERLVRSGYFFGALLAHLVLFLMVATWIVFEAPSKPTDNTEFNRISVKITPPPPPPEAPSLNGAAANNPQFEPQAVTVPVVTPPSVISSFNNTMFTIDTSKAITDSLNHVTDRTPTGSGLGPAGGGSETGTGNGFFGSTDQASNQGFEGDFYDFTRTQSGKATGMDASTYADVIRAFCKTWGPPDKYPCYKSHVSLFSRYFFFPPIADALAGAAFKTPSSTEAFWIAHYHGSFTADTGGEFRLVGFGDNLLAVRVNGRTVLDASDLGFLGNGRKDEGGITLPGKNNATPLFMGESFVLEPGQSIHFDIVVGDEGGIFCAGLFLAPKDTTLTFTAAGVPKLPLFVVGNVNNSDKQNLSKYLPPECFESPINFSIVAETPSGF